MNQMETKRKQIMLLLYAVGMVTFILLYGRLGDNGAAYLAAAAESYTLVYILTVAFLPEAMERLIRARMTKGQYKNADRMFRVAVLYALAAGGLCTALLYGLSGVWMEKVLRMPYGTLALWLLLPTYFFSALGAALKGYFQGTGTAMPTVVAQAAKYLFALTFALLFAYIFSGYGRKVSVLLQNADFEGMYAGGGAAVGISLAAFLSVLFLLLVYLGAGRRGRQKNREGMRLTEEYASSVRLLLFTMFPAAASAALLKLPGLLGLFFFQRSSRDMYGAAYSYGKFYIRYEAWVFMGAAFVAAGALAMAGKASAHVRREEYRQTKDCLQTGVTWVFACGAFMAAFFMAVGPGLAEALYGTDAGVARMFGFGSPVVVFAGMCVYFQSILWDNGKAGAVLLYLCASLSAYVAVLLAALKLNGGRAENLAYAQTVFFGAACAAGGILVFRQFKCRPDWLRGIVFPVLSAAVSGGVMWLLRLVAVPALGGLLGAAVCLVSGLLCHTVLFLALRCARERDMAVMPGGKLLIGAGKILHLL